MPWKDDLPTEWQRIKQSRARQGPSSPRRRPIDEIRFDLYPYLNCTSQYYRKIPGPRFRSSIGEIKTIPPGMQWSPRVTVWNSGSFPTWTCYVEIRENPGDIVKNKTIIKVQPGQKRQITLSVTAGQEGTSLVGLCYDPIYDPYDPNDPTGRKSAPLALIMGPQMRRFTVARVDYSTRILLGGV